MEELYRSAMIWVDQHCSLVEIRPGKLSILCFSPVFSFKFNQKPIESKILVIFLVLAVSDKLRYLSTTTDLLSEPPSTLQEEVLKAISSSNVGSSTSLL